MMTPEAIRAAMLSVAAFATCGALFIAGWVEGGAHVQAKWDADRAAKSEAAVTRLSDVLATQQSLQKFIEEGREDRKNAEIRIGRLYGVAVDGLRNRPTDRAPNGVPDAASAGAGCTGAGLARPDGEFLARYAADAAKLQSALDQCRAGYGAAKDRLDALDAAGAMK